MAQDKIKVSTRSILALVQAKKLRKAGQELKKLQPVRKQIYGYDRLVAAVHSPVPKAEKLYYEAVAMVPDLVGQGEGDPATRGQRTRSAIRRLMKARTIVRDDPGINGLFKKCLTSLQDAENKVSAAQGLAMRGDWASAYKEIKEASKLDDSPEVRETRKLIAEHYRIQSKDAEGLKRTMTIAKIGVAVIIAAVIGIFVLKCSLQEDVDAARRQEAAKRKRLGLADPVATAPAPPSPAPFIPASPPPAAPAPAVPASPAAVPVSPAPAAPAVPEKPAQQAIEIRADAPAGTSLGFLPAGTRITLRYKEGSWMPWRNRIGFSPDAPSEAGKRHCLALRGTKPDGTAKILQVVPFHTREKPFTYEVAGDWAGVALVINDDDGNFENNDGAVSYEVLVVKP